jgi:hypothetical protein
MERGILYWQITDDISAPVVNFSEFSELVQIVQQTVHRLHSEVHSLFNEVYRLYNEVSTVQ